MEDDRSNGRDLLQTAKGQPSKLDANPLCTNSESDRDPPYPENQHHD